MAGYTRALAVVPLILLASCAAPTLRSPDVEQQIGSALAEQVGGRFAVTCPTGISAESGAGFTCTVTDEQTQTRLTVEVRQEDDQGAFSWRMVPASAPAPSPGASP